MPLPGVEPQIISAHPYSKALQPIYDSSNTCSKTIADVQVTARLNDDLRAAVRNKGVNFELFEAVQGQLDNALGKNSDHQIALSHFQDRLQQAHVRERAAAAEIASLKEELVGGGQHSTESDRLEIGRLQDEVAHLKSALRHTENNADSLFELHSAHQEEKNEQQAAIADLQAQLLLAQQEQRQAESLRGYQDTTAAYGLRRRIEELEDRCGGLFAELETLRKEHSAEKSRADTVEAHAEEIEHELDTLRRMHELLREEHEQLKQQSSALQQQSRNADSLADEAESQASQVSQAAQQLSAQVNRDSPLLSSELFRSLSDSQDQQQLIEAEILELKSELAAAAAKAAELSAAKSSWQETEADLQAHTLDLSRDLQAAQACLETERQEGELLREALETAEQSVTEKEQHINSLTSEIDLVLSDLKAAEAALMGSQTALELSGTAEAELSKQRVESAALKEQLHAVEEESEMLRNQLTSNSEQINQRLQKQYEELEQELRITKEAANSFAPQQLAKLSMEVARLKQDLHEADASAANAQAENTASVQQLSAQLYAAASEKEALQAELQEMRQQAPDDTAFGAQAEVSWPW